jgi:hypothetical protein
MWAGGENTMATPIAQDFFIEIRCFRQFFRISAQKQPPFEANARFER